MFRFSSKLIEAARLRLGHRLLLTGLVVIGLVALVSPDLAMAVTPNGAAASPVNTPLLSLNMGGASSHTPGEVSNVLKIIGLMTLLSMAPALVVTMTSFTRIIIVLSFLRQAIGTHQSPPNQVLVGLALFMTWFVMSPTIEQVYVNAYEPYMEETISTDEAIDSAISPIRGFMLKYTREADLALFINAAKLPRPKNVDEVPMRALIPAFMISELKTAFQIGFMIYLPFLIIDIVVASVLLAMGMMVLPPVMISLPFKLMLFVLVDGWNLLTTSLLGTFN